MDSPSSQDPSSSLPGLLLSMILLGVGILATLPVFWSGNVIAADSLSHLVMSRNFIDQLASGELYPRWLAGLNDGLGSPVMFFYGPVAYYITALFRPLVGSDPEGWHQLGLAAGLAVTASGFTAYVWLRQLGNRNAALIGAILYMGTPYRLMLELYQHLKLAELWGGVWMPLVLWRIHAVVEGRKGAALWLAASYALLIMTHLPTTLLFSLLPPLYALCLAPKGCRLRVGAKVVGAMLLGVGLSAVFLVPALGLQPFVQFQAMESGSFYFANNFLFYGPRVDSGADEILKYLGTVMASTAMVIAGAYGLGKRLLPASGERIAHFWALTGALVFFMMLPLSKPVWELLPVLQKVQFPWRFGAVLPLAMAALLTLWLAATGRLLSRANLTLLLIVGLVALTQLVPLFKVYRTYPVWMGTPSLALLHDQTALRNDPASVLFEAAKINSYMFFLPNWVAPGLMGDSVHSFDTLRKIASGPDVVPLAAAQVQISHVNSRHMVLMVQSEAPLALRVKQLYFPGWTATIAGTHRVLKVRPSRPSGLLEVDVPTGHHVIDLVLQATPAERAGRIISLLSVIVFLAGWAMLYLARGGNRFSLVSRNVPAQVEAADRSTRLKQD